MIFNNKRLDSLEIIVEDLLDYKDKQANEIERLRSLLDDQTKKLHALQFELFDYLKVERETIQQYSYLKKVKK